MDTEAMFDPDQTWRTNTEDLDATWPVHDRSSDPEPATAADGDARA